MRKMTPTQLADWNETFSVGHPCILVCDGGNEMTTRTTSKAWNLGSGHTVISVEGKSGGWDIDRVKMMETHTPRPQSGGTSIA